MTTAAQSVIKKAAILLQDTAGIRWKAGELVGWLNDGQREVVMYRPDANARIATGTLAPGVRQDMSTMTGVANLKPAKLIDVVRNVAATSAMNSIRQIERTILDNAVPGWTSADQSIDIVHFMYDPRTPLQFLVYPPALSGALVEIVISAFPDDVTTPTGDDYTAVTGNIGVSDTYANALLDYVMFRAYLKDSEFTGDATRAVAHYQAFGNAIGVDLKAGITVSPSGPMATFN